MFSSRASSFWRQGAGKLAESMAATDAERAAVLREYAHSVREVPGSFNALFEHLGRPRAFLFGEASHGTEEFYRMRADLTRELIERGEIHFVAVEADWPDAYRIDRFVKGMGPDRTAEQALSDFDRFPRWMWRNTAVRDFVQWLREFNDRQPTGSPKVGFFGLDFYCMFKSADVVIEFMEKHQPDLAPVVRKMYSCFDHVGRDEQLYGFSTQFGTMRHCEDEVVRVLRTFTERASELERERGVAEDHVFYAHMNAKLVRDAERYYRAMFRTHDTSWNVRDTHMADTFMELLAYHDKQLGGGARARGAVWAHNSHVGDASQTDMKRRGELNLGQLLRERLGPDHAKIVGFSTYEGTVLAASNWGEPGWRQRVQPGLAGSYEALLHEVGLPSFYLLLPLRDRGLDALPAERLERAIGVVYKPKTERQSHYFPCRLPKQMDAVIHVDRSSAVTPLDKDTS